MIYYRHLFHSEEKLSANEGILYSELIYRSLLTDEFMFNGKFSPELAKGYLQHIEDKGRLPYIDMCPFNVSRLADRLEMSRPAINRNKEKLIKKRLLIPRSLSKGDYFILCPSKILDGGYINLPMETGLSGRQLVFYGCLLDRGQYHAHTVDTWAKRLGEIYGLNEENVFSLIRILKKAGYVERLPNGKLNVVAKQREESPDSSQ